MSRLSLRRSLIFSTAACLLIIVAPGIRAAEPLELQNRRETPPPSQILPRTSPQIQQTPQTPQVPQIIVPSAPVTPQVTVPEVQEPQAVIPPVVVTPSTPAQPQTQPAPPPQESQIPSVVIVPQIPEATPPEIPTPEVRTPEKDSDLPLTPESFLLTTPAQEKKPAPKPEEKPAQAEKKPQAEEKKPEKAEAPKKGDPLKIPEEAKKTGQLDFLEGCWVGTRPEYNTKRIITERFCFGKDGVGKRFIEDPAYAGQCVGATRAAMNQGGVLHMQSEKMFCTNTPENWGGSEMTCQGEGEQTPCSWVFTDAGGARQSYTIRFVRE